MHSSHFQSTEMPNTAYVMGSPEHWVALSILVHGTACTLGQRQHEFVRCLRQLSLLPLPLGEGRSEDPQVSAKAPHPNPLPGGRAPVKLGALCRRSRRGGDRK